MPQPPLIRIAAAVIRDGDGRCLLVRKRGTSALMQPGGKLEPGESAIAALARELREELGLDISADAARPLGRHAAPAANEPGHRVEAELFAVAWPDTALLSPAAEIAEALWVDPANPPSRPIAPLTRDIILPLLTQS